MAIGAVVGKGKSGTDPTKASVQAQLDKMPNGDKYTTRQNSDGTISVVQKDASNPDTHNIRVNEDGELYTPNAVQSEHGNTLNDTPAECYGLHCRDTGDIKKYGETIYGEDKYGVGNQQRYPKDYLKENNVDYVPITKGTKKDMHQIQHQLIEEHKINNDGKRPDLNLNDY